MLFKAIFIFRSLRYLLWLRPENVGPAMQVYPIWIIKIILKKGCCSIFFQHIHPLLLPSAVLISDLICIGLLSLGAVRPPGPKEQQAVQADIDDQDSCSQCHLGRAGQARRVKERLDIMFDKTSLVAGNTALQAQPIFQWSERADTARYYNPGGPGYRRKMDPEQVSPPVHQQPPQDSKKHKEKMHNDHDVGSSMIDHLPFKLNQPGGTRFSAPATTRDETTCGQANLWFKLRRTLYRLLACFALPDN